MSRVRLKRDCPACGKQFVAKSIKGVCCSRLCSSHYRYSKKVSDKFQNINNIEEIDVKQKTTGEPIINKQKFLSTQEATDLLGISKSTANRYCVNGNHAITWARSGAHVNSVYSAMMKHSIAL